MGPSRFEIIKHFRLVQLPLEDIPGSQPQLHQSLANKLAFFGALIYKENTNSKAKGTNISITIHWENLTTGSCCYKHQIESGRLHIPNKKKKCSSI